MKKALILLVFVFFNLSVQAGWGPDLCEDVTCSGHGYCEEDGSDEWCVCDSGYIAEGLNCVLGCDGETCSGHGTCEVGGGTQYCLCESGFHAVGMQCIVDGASSVDNLIILNESECSNTGNCHYRFIFATNYYNFTPENASLYDIIINVKDPENNWHNYWKTVETCAIEGICITLDDQYIDFQWDHRISGSQYIAVEVTGNGDDAYDHIYHTCSVPCGNGVVEGDEECDDGNFVDFDGCTGCRKDFYIGNPEECETQRYCEFVFSAGFVDKMRENSVSDKEIKIEIGFGDGGSFSKSLNYCLKNRYCFEDAEGNIIFRKKYYNSQNNPVVTETTAPGIGTVGHGSTSTGSEVPPCSEVECVVIAPYISLTPQKFTDGENEDYIGSLYVSTRLFDLADENERVLNDMRVHGWGRYFEKNSKIFIYADVPTGYEIRDFGEGEWIISTGQNPPQAMDADDLKEEVVNEIRVMIYENEDLNDTQKAYADGLVTTHAVSENFYEDVVNDSILSAFITTDQQNALLALSEYRNTQFFTLYKITAPSTTESVYGEIKYKGALPEIFDYYKDEDPEVDTSGLSGEECWGKTGQDLWSELFRNINVSDLKICIGVGEKGTDDDVYVKFNNVDDKVEVSPDEPGIYRPSLFYLDNEKNNFESNTKDCFFIKTDQVVVYKIKDIEFIKLAKYPFDRGDNIPSTNPGNDDVDVKDLELFVNGVKIFSKTFSPSIKMDDPNDEAGAVPYVVIEENEIISNPYYKFGSFFESVNNEGEMYKIFRVSDFLNKVSGTDLMQSIECTIGHLTEVDDTYHKSSPDIDLSLEAGHDYVTFDYQDPKLVDVNFGLTDKSWWPFDFDMYVVAEFRIAYEETLDINNNVIGHHYRLALENFETSFDGWDGFLSFSAFAFGWLPNTFATFHLANFSEKFLYLANIDFNDEVDEIGTQEITSISTNLANNVFFNIVNEEITLNIDFTNRVKAGRIIQSIILTCIDDEIGGSSDCLFRFPNSVNEAQNLAGE